MADDPIWDAYNNGKPRPRLVGGSAYEESPRPELILQPARLPSPDQIPPRQWLYGTQLIRGYVTVLVAPGGTGKSAYAMGVVLSLVSGMNILGETPRCRVNGSIINLEDPLEELERRVAALMMRHEIPTSEVESRLFINDSEGRGLTMASVGDDGVTVIHPDEDKLIAEILNKQIGVIVCDPFAESHTLEENSNPQMVKAASAWRRVARATGCAVFLIHHVRKGDATGIDAARGAKALTDSARVGLLMTKMAEKEAETFGIDNDDMWKYVRLDDAKTNMAPASKAKWFLLDQVHLGNGTQEYKNGDTVAAIVEWNIPSLFGNHTPAELNEVLDVINEGPEPGILYTATKQGGSDRSVVSVIVRMLDVAEGKAKKMVKEWLKSGLLWEDEYKHPKYRRMVRGVRVNHNKRPSI